MARGLQLPACPEVAPADRHLQPSARPPPSPRLPEPEISAIDDPTGPPVPDFAAPRRTIRPPPARPTRNDGICVTAASGGRTPPPPGPPRPPPHRPHRPDRPHRPHRPDRRHRHPPA